MSLNQFTTLLRTTLKMNGIFAVNKPTGPSSADIIAQVKRALNSSKLVEGSDANTGNDKKKKFQKNRKKGHQWWKNKQQDIVKVGHGGTLDPLASGVVVVGVGEGTRKLTHFLTDCTKTYEATALFGVSTDTYDSTGKILEYGPTSHLTLDLIKDAIASKFSGEIVQFPPVYSALKMNGKPLYEYAREGIPLPKPIEPRKVTVNFFNVVDKDLNWDQTEYGLPADGEATAEEKELIIKQNQEMLKHVDTSSLDKLTSSVALAETEVKDEENKKYPTLKFRFSVSSGTYIRSLIHDLAKAVGSTAHMTKLVRVQQGPFELEKNVFDLEDITKNLPDSEWVPLVEAMIAHGPETTIDALKTSERVKVQQAELAEQVARDLEETAKREAEQAAQKAEREAQRAAQNAEKAAQKAAEKAEQSAANEPAALDTEKQAAANAEETTAEQVEVETENKVESEEPPAKKATLEDA